MRYDVTFIGRVQGVGFRATAKSLAAEHGVVGWVRNEADGSVRLVVEGPKETLDAYLEALRERLNDYVREERVEEGAERGDYAGFEIRY